MSAREKEALLWGLLAITMLVGAISHSKWYFTAYWGALAIAFAARAAYIEHREAKKHDR